MINYYKTIVGPLLAVIFLIVSAITGVTVSEDVQVQVVTAIGDFISICLVIYGIFKNHKK